MSPTTPAARAGTLRIRVPRAGDRVTFVNCQYVSRPKAASVALERQRVDEPSTETSGRMNDHSVTELSPAPGNSQPTHVHILGNRSLPQ